MEKNKDCIFCKIVNREIKSEIVYSDDNFIGILDVNPVAEGHVLIIPKKHFRNLLDMPVSLGNELLEAVKKISLKLIEDKKAEGINVLSNNESVSGQVVFHAHIHVVPRNKNDGIRVLEKED